MTGYITLMGAEQVQSAASRMGSAAEDIRRAAGSMDDSFQPHEQFLDEWLRRFEVAVEKHGEILAAHAELLANHAETVGGK